jgi:hypothetical protein
LPREALERERVLREIEEERERLQRARVALDLEAETQAAREREFEMEREQDQALARLRSEKELQNLQRELLRARGEIHQAREQLKRKDLTRAEVKSLEKSVSAAAGAGARRRSHAARSPRAAARYIRRSRPKR